MFEASNMPLLPGEARGRVRTVVNPEDLNGIGVSGSAFALHKGDVIEFPDENPLVVSQKINDTENAPVAYYVAVNRNGKPSWLGIGNLTRRDYTGKGLGKFQEEMLTYPSFKEIYDALRGKKIQCGELKEHKFYSFKDGIRTDELQTRYYPEIEYVK